MAKYTLEQKFKTLCQITRASHFEWRETFKKMYPDMDIKEAIECVKDLMVQCHPKGLTSREALQTLITTAEQAQALEQENKKLRLGVEEVEDFLRTQDIPRYNFDLIAQAIVSYQDKKVKRSYERK